jgi:hypothetical protein
MSRLKLDMGFNDILFAMSKGNPGAINVIMDSLKHGEEIDPDNGFKSWGLAINLDTVGVYDSRIWMLYKDVCRENLAHTIGMARSVQLGIVTAEELHQAIEGKRTIDVEATLAKVCEQLPRFNKEYHCTL